MAKIKMACVRDILLVSLLICARDASSLRRGDNGPIRRRSDRARQQQHDHGHAPDRTIALSTADYFDFLHVSRQKSSSLYSKRDEDLDASHQTSAAWPPWPFNLLSSKSKQSSSQSSASNQHPSLIFPFLQASTRAAVLQAKALASQLWLHAPPAAPPLVLLALIPQRQSAADGVSKTVIPLFNNPFVQSIALASAGLAVMSWAHAQLLRKRQLTPLPLPYSDITRAILPPFLPDVDDEAWPFMTNENSGSEEQDTNQSNTSIPKSLRKFLSKPSGVTFADWRRMRRERQAERRHRRRITIMEQCMALQRLKKQQKSERRRNDVSIESELGYALVTGASKGLGRAIAVELARWGIPLILLARDLDRLTALAYDLEACYGIKCCVLQADLTKHGEAERVHHSTRSAGLRVDVLVNNAGISSHGNSVDLPLADVQSMIQLNVMSTSTLTHLYGKDMKDQRRGRILTVSSICGVVAGIPSVAVYSATKAFEKTLSLSVAKELEKFGVGVTCLLPGAVSETGFRKNSNAQDALCWKIPYYARPPRQVAEAGVRAMLLGDTEVMPGWMNRAFIKVMMPIIPQRLHNSIAEVMWNPLDFPLLGMLRKDRSEEIDIDQDDVIRPFKRFKFHSQSPPRLLQMQKATSDEWSGDDVATLGSAECHTEYENTTTDGSEPSTTPDNER